MEPQDLLAIRRRLCHSHGTPEEREFYLANRTPELLKRDSCVCPIPYQIILLGTVLLLPALLFWLLPLNRVLESNYSGFLSNGAVTAFLFLSIAVVSHGLESGLKYRRATNQDSIVETSLVASGVLTTLACIPAIVLVSWFGFEQYEFAITGMMSFITLVIGAVFIRGVILIESMPWGTRSTNPSVMSRDNLCVSVELFVYNGLVTVAVLGVVTLWDFLAEGNLIAEQNALLIFTALVSMAIFYYRQARYFKRRRLWRLHGPYPWRTPLSEIE